MLDIKFIRENETKVKERLALRGKSYDEEIAAALALTPWRWTISASRSSWKWKV